MASSFWDLKVVQVAYRLLSDVYDVTEAFSSKERFRMVDQLCRASTSVPAKAKGAIRGPIRPTSSTSRGVH